VNGKMLWFNEAKGYGFIEAETGERVYVRGSAFLAGHTPIGRCKGLAVRFALESGEASAGACADIDEASALAKSGDDDVDGAGDLRKRVADCCSHGCVLAVDEVRGLRRAHPRTAGRAPEQRPDEHAARHGGDRDEQKVIAKEVDKFHGSRSL